MSVGLIIIEGLAHLLLLHVGVEAVIFNIADVVRVWVLGWHFYHVAWPRSFEILRLVELGHVHLKLTYLTIQIFLLSESIWFLSKVLWILNSLHGNCGDPADHSSVKLAIIYETRVLLHLLSLNHYLGPLVNYFRPILTLGHHRMLYLTLHPLRTHLGRYTRAHAWTHAWTDSLAHIQTHGIIWADPDAAIILL